jgi:uncharacterized protein
MSKYIAFKAIDFFFTHNKLSKEINISFYGGEPLLNFKLIKQCVEYVRRLQDKREITFTITTNGTLLKNEIIDYLAQNKIGLAISLDGPKEVHDRYRIFPDGRGSFDLIMKNVSKIKKRAPQYFNKFVTWSIVLSPPFEPLNVDRFIKENPGLFEKKIPLVSYVKFFDTNFYNNFNKKHLFNSLDYQKELLMKDFILSIIKKKPNPGDLAHRLFAQLYRTIHTRKPSSKFGREFPLSSICIPGRSRLFVDVKGDFHICENIGSFMPIGNVNKGFDFDKISSLIEEYINISNNDCCNCWAIRLCDLCFLSAAQGRNFNIEKKRRICKNFKEKLEEALIGYNEILEKHNNVLDYLVDIPKESII